MFDLNHTQKSVKIPKKCQITKHSPPEAWKRRKDEEPIWTTQTLLMKPQTYKEELQQRNRLGMVSKITTGFLLARNLALNSDATPNYKYMFGLDKVLCLICETSQWDTYNQKRLWWNKTNGSMAIWSQDTRKQHRAPTIWNILRREPSFSLRTDPSLCN